MKNLLLTTVLAAAFTVTACTTTTKSATDLPVGEYESKTTKTTASGTKYTTTERTEVEYEDGQKKATVESETTKDPKGLFNQETTSKSKVVVTE